MFDRIKFLKELLAGDLEKHGSTIMVLAKNKIMEYGCAHSEDGIAWAKKQWEKAASLYDIKWLPELVEQQVENYIWMQIEKGIRLFISKVCTVPAGASASDERFGSVSLKANREVQELANDGRLPAL